MRAGEVTFHEDGSGQTDVVMRLQHQMPELLLDLKISPFNVEQQLKGIFAENLADFKALAELMARDPSRVPAVQPAQDLELPEYEPEGDEEVLRAAAGGEQGEAPRSAGTSAEAPAAPAAPEPESAAGPGRQKTRVEAAPAVAPAAEAPAKRSHKAKAAPPPPQGPGSTPADAPKPKAKGRPKKTLGEASTLSTPVAEKAAAPHTPEQGLPSGTAGGSEPKAKGRPRGTAAVQPLALDPTVTPSTRTRRSPQVASKQRPK